MLTAREEAARNRASAEILSIKDRVASYERAIEVGVHPDDDTPLSVIDRSRFAREIVRLKVRGSDILGSVRW